MVGPDPEALDVSLLDRAFAAVYDRFMAPVEEASLGPQRRELLAGVSGHVLDLGAGTGANLAHLPDGVDRITAVEPSPEMAAKLRDRIARSPDLPPVEVVEAPAEHLPLADASVDHAIATLVLCTVDDQRAAIDELRRVLKPGGSLVVLEHVHAEGASGTVARAIEPAWTVIARGCRLTRDTRTALNDGGFDVTRIGPTTWPGPRFVSTGIRGTATVR